MSYEVLITRLIPEPGIRLLREADVALRIHEEDRPMRREELLTAVQRVDGVVCLLTDRIDAEILDQSNRAMGYANYAVGYENIDTEHATALGIMVSNTPGVLTEATADLTWSLLLAVARRVVPGDTMVRQGRFKGWGPMLLLGADLFEKTLGIVGAGRIGSAVARRAQGFGMRILYADTCGKPQMDLMGATCVTVEELLRESDVVSLHVPLTPQTRHLIDAGAIRLMKRSALLINTSRGPVVDEPALVEALQSGRLAGAGLDVFEQEPRVHPGLLALPTVVLLPHLGSATVETRSRMAVMAARNMLAMLRGQMPENLVNPSVWERRRSIREARGGA